MKRLRIGIDGKEFNTWSGGIDFIAMIAEALASTGKADTFLIAEENSELGNIWISFSCWIKAGYSLKRARLMKERMHLSNNNMINTFRVCSPMTIPIIFRKTENRLLNNREKKQLACLRSNSIDIILPSSHCESPDFGIPRIGYIFDFQHKYLRELFTEKECHRRDVYFKNQLKNSRYLIVNAQTVKSDIKKFYPNESCEIIVLPFKPFQRPVINKTIELRKYNLPERYYVICNQFWMHKSHITAFEALEYVYNSGLKDIHIVCTGLLQDDRDPEFVGQLWKKIGSLNCKKNIHILGFIPKEDQIAVMKNGIGLIQPTLFEGGPGGGAVYNAICLGMPCLISDIPVNREIKDQDNVYFFRKKDSRALARLMIQHRDDKPKDENIIRDMIERNRREYGEFLLNKLKDIVKKESLEAIGQEYGQA